MRSPLPRIHHRAHRKAVRISNCRKPDFPGTRDSGVTRASQMPTSGADLDIIFKLGVSSYLVEEYGLHKRIV
jgi:hypothetical protein